LDAKVVIADFREPLTDMRKPVAKRKVKVILKPSLPC